MGFLLTCCEKQSLSTWPARASYPRRRGWDTDVLLETRGTTYVQVNRRFTGHAPGGSEAGRGFEGYSPRSPFILLLFKRARVKWVSE